MSQPSNILSPLLTNSALIIDNSFIESLTTCPRKLYYGSILRRTPSSDRPALSFGTAIHQALEWRYKKCKNESVGVLEESEQQKILVDYFAANPQPEDDHRQLGYAIEIVKRYNQRYNVEPWQLLTKEDDDSEVLCELSFTVPLGLLGIASGRIIEWDERFSIDHSLFIPVVYAGRIDLPVKWDDQIIVVDHKTTSMLGDFYFDGQRVASQYEGYGWAFQQISGKEVAGFCVNAIRTKTMPAKPTKGWDVWWDESFARHKEYFRPGQLEEWRVNTLAHIEEFYWHAQREFFPQRKKACTMYGKCAYYDVCYLTKEQREGELRSDKFQDNDWTPLKAGQGE